MQELNRVIASAYRAWETFHQLAQASSPARLEAFARSFEAVRPAAQSYLAYSERIDALQADAAVLVCWRAGVLTEQEAIALLETAADYDSIQSHSSGADVLERLPGHVALLRTWVERLRLRTAAAFLGV